MQPPSTSVSMQNSSVLIVHPSDYRFPMAGSGKFGGRHYSLDSPGSLASPPGYDMPMMEQKPAVAATLGLSMPNSCGAGPVMSTGSHHFSQINPHLVYSPTAHAGLLPLSEFYVNIVFISIKSFVSFANLVVYECFFSILQILLLWLQSMLLILTLVCIFITLLDQCHPLCPLDDLTSTEKASNAVIELISLAINLKNWRRLLKRHAILMCSCVKNWQ